MKHSRAFGECQYGFVICGSSKKTIRIICHTKAVWRQKATKLTCLRNYIYGRLSAITCFTIAVKYLFSSGIFALFYPEMLVIRCTPNFEIHLVSLDVKAFATYFWQLQKVSVTFLCRETFWIQLVIFTSVPEFTRTYIHTYIRTYTLYLWRVTLNS